MRNLFLQLALGLFSGRPSLQSPTDKLSVNKAHRTGKADDQPHNQNLGRRSGPDNPSWPEEHNKHAREHQDPREQRGTLRCEMPRR